MCEVILQSGNVRLQHPSVSPGCVRQVWWCLMISLTTYPHPRDALQLGLRQISNNHRGVSGPTEQHFIMRGVLCFKALCVHVRRDRTRGLHSVEITINKFMKRKKKKKKNEKRIKQQLLTSEMEYTLSIHSWGALNSGSQLTTTPTIWPLVSITTSPTRRNTYGGRGLRTVLEAAGSGQRRRGFGLCSKDKTRTQEADL